MSCPSRLPGIVGRDEELAAVTAFVDGDLPTALVLDGEAGIGKTTLFEAAVSEARERGFAVFSCRPAGAEAAFSFAALADLLRPVLPDGLARLPSPQRRALAAALLLEDGEGSAPDERAIAFAVFQLLGERREPLLVAVDDVQWLDAASASVLGFALRRLAAAPAAILIARRSDGSEPVPLGLERAFPEERLRRLRLGPLSVGATHRLLRERLGVSFPRHTLLQLHQRSGGNPFYALEFARALEQSGDLRDSRVAHRACLRTARGVAGGRSRGARADRAAQRANHLHRRGSGLRPDDGARTPSRSAGRCDPGARRRRTRSFQPSAAGRAGRGGARPSAAAIAPSPSREARRRRRAARAAPRAGRGQAVDQGRRRAGDRFGCRGLAWRIGGGRRAGRALALAHADHGWRRRPPPPPAARRRPALRERGRGAVACDPRAARSSSCHRVPNARACCDGSERPRLTTSRDRSDSSSRRSSRPRPIARLKAEIVMPRVMTAFLRHGPAAAVKLARELGSGRGGQRRPRPARHVPGGAQLRGALRGRFDTGSARACARARAAGRALADADHADARRGAAPAVRRRARCRRRGPGTGTRRGGSQRRRVGTGQCLALSDRARVPRRRLGPRRRVCGGNAPVGERWGLEFQGGSALWIRGLVDAYLGRLDEARARATEGVVALARGERAGVPRAEPCPARSDRPVHRRLPRRRRRRWLRSSAGARHVVRASRASTRPGSSRSRRWSRSATSTRPASSSAGWKKPAAGSGLPGRLRWARAAGASSRQPRETSKRRSQAASKRWRCTSGCRRRSSAPAPCSSTARSFAGPSGERRRGRRSRQALSIFEALPAPVWAENARAELARIGGRAPSGGGLTASERRIAELVAAGKSNKETAAALFLSVHTVEDALKRVYRKLGVRSRTELSRRLAPTLEQRPLISGLSRGRRRS